VAAIDIPRRAAGIGAVEQARAIGRHRDMFDDELARGQQHRLAAGRGERVEMRPAVHFGAEGQPVARAPFEVQPARHLRIGAAQRIRALPHALRGAAVGGGDP